MKRRNLLSFILVFALLTCMVNLNVYATDEGQSLEYIYYNESGEAVNGSISSYNVVSTADETWADGWYVAEGNVSIANTVKVLGNVHLILKNGATLNANGGIQVRAGNSLIIYAQSKQVQSNTGVLKATGVDYCAGIGGIQNTASGNIEVWGGIVYAYGGTDASGIGDGKNGSYGGSVTIKNGSVYAEGKNGADAITSSYITVIPETGATTINVQSADGTHVYGSPFASIKNIEYLIRGISNIQIITHRHEFVGIYKDNGDGTHSRQCNGCEVYNEAVAHEYSNGKCACNATIPAYMRYDANTKTFLTDYIANYQFITDEDTVLTSGWYVVDGVHEFKNGLTYDGDVNLILKDKCLLKASQIESKEYTKNERDAGKHATLTIYAQSDATKSKNTGRLETFGDGLLASTKESHLIIHGGNLTGAMGAYWNATLTIFGGKINASRIDNVGIFCAEDASVTIAGGEVTACGNSAGAGIGGIATTDTGEITITGGKVIAYANGNGAGIGTGDDSAFVGTQADVGKITITGGEVLAYSNGEGAGIGGGYVDDGGEVVITGGKVTAYSKKNGAGIGGGRDGTFYEGEGGNVTITGGEVLAYSCGDGSGIGGGRKGVGGSVKVTGGTVTAYSCGDGSGIGGGTEDDGGIFTMYGGTVTAYSACDGAGIGGGYKGDGGEFNFHGGSLHAYSLGDGTAVGYGENGEDGEITVDNNLIVFDNLLNKLCTTNFYKTWNNFFKASEIDIAAITGKDYPIPYQKINASGLAENLVCDDYKIIDVYTTGLTTGWYVMDGKGTTNSMTSVTIDGDVNLILMNDSELTIPTSIKINRGANLTVYSQNTEDGSVEGKINITNSSIFSFNNPGIIGSLILYGGTINTLGQKGQPGLAGDLTIYGGTLTAKGGQGSVGIGGGYEIWGGDISIYGGNLTAIAGPGASRGIGPRTGNQCCGIIVANGTSILDSQSLEQLRTSVDRLTWSDVLSGESISIKAVNQKYYLSYNKDTNSLQVNTCLNYSTVTNNTTCLTDGWYVLGAKDVTINDNVTVDGNVNLILEDGYTLNVNGNIQIVDGASLSVHAQSTKKNMGKLIINGSNDVAVKGDFRIYGGNVITKGGDNFESISGYLTIYGGSLTATAGEGAHSCIADGSGTSGNTVITLGEKVVLIDKTTNEAIQKDEALSWNDVLNGSAISFFVIYPKSYIEYDETEKSFVEKDCLIYDVINSDTKSLNDGWYVLEQNISIDHAITVTGDAHLLLGDGCKLKAEKGIVVNQGNSLTIYSQSMDDKMGTLIATGNDHSAGIGGEWNRDSGLITIHGGNITATGGNAIGNNGGYVVGGAAGIGGGENGGAGLFAEGGGVVIYGGNINAYGGSSSAGIGSGYGKDIFSGEIIINGGNIKAVGGELNSNGGGAGIGTGWYGCGDYVTINGGNVEAIGGFGAAGIGGGMNGMGCILTINDGTVVARGGTYGAGIGSGAYGHAYDDGGQLIFNGGNLTAIGNGKNAKSIGASDGGSADGDIVINGNINIKAGDSAEDATLMELDAFVNTRSRYVNISEYNPSVDNELTLNISDDGSFNVTPLGKDAGTGVVMVALYDEDNRLLESKIFDISNGESPQGAFGQIGLVKAMWLDNIDSMNPLCEAVSGMEDGTYGPVK